MELTEAVDHLRSLGDEYEESAQTIQAIKVLDDADVFKDIDATRKYTLELDGEEAGFLLDLLGAHVGGTLVSGGQPLGRVLDKLEHQGVLRFYAKNFASGYANLHDARTGYTP